MLHTEIEELVQRIRKHEVHSETVTLRHLNLWMLFPIGISKEVQLGRINFVEKIVENFYCAGVSYESGGGCGWILEINPEGGFFPVRNLSFK